MDRIDKKILSLLQENSRISNQELADQVSLSPSPCLRRVKQLEEKGFIKQHVALLNPQKLGLGLTIILLVGLEKHDPKIMQQFENAIKKTAEVVECLLITGHSADYMLKVMVPDMQHYQHFLLDRLTQLEGVKSVRSSFVMQQIIDKTALPLDFL